VGVVHFLNELPHSLSWRGPAAVAPRLLTELSTDCVGNCDGDCPSPRSHPGRVLLRRRSMLIVGAPPPVRRVKPEHRANRYSHPGRVLLRRRRVHDCRSTAPGAKGKARTPSRPLFAPGAGAPTGEAHVV